MKPSSTSQGSFSAKIAVQSSVDRLAHPDFLFSIVDIVETTVEIHFKEGGEAEVEGGDVVKDALRRSLSVRWNR